MTRRKIQKIAQGINPHWSAQTKKACWEIINNFSQQSKQPKIRTLEEFAETLIIPTGAFQGSLFRYYRQPFIRLLYREIDSGRWNTICTTGNTQSGKSLACTNIPIVWFTFEKKEGCVFGAPTAEMATDKWIADIKPLIESSGYASLMSEHGKGSRGGTDINMLQFKNGARIKVMTGNGGDEKRSGYAARYIVMTECDKMDDARQSSDEADPIKQIIARADSYSLDDKLIFMECTVSHSKGHIWQTYINSSRSKIVCPCPHCSEYISPDREDLLGWQDASTERDAELNAYWRCPSCGKSIDEQQRRNMNADGVCKLIHNGQTIDKSGIISGDAPPTRTLGFKWNAFNNMFHSTGEIGRREYLASRAEDVVSAEREMLQFVWTRPADPDVEEVKELSAVDLRGRKLKGCGRGICPKDTTFITAGIDIGKWRCWAVYIAWTVAEDIEDNRMRGQVIDYQSWKLNQDRDTTEQAAKIAIREALTNYMNYYSDGFPTLDGRSIPIMFTGIDSGYLSECIYDYCIERYREIGFFDCFPIKGFGQSMMATPYRKPGKCNNTIKLIGNHYHQTWIPSAGTYLMELDADYWKSQVRERLSISSDNPQSISLFDSPNNGEHTKYIMHLMSEKPVIAATPRGDKLQWVKTPGGGPNHWFDATAYAMMMSSYSLAVLQKERIKENVKNNYVQNFIQSDFLRS